MEVGPIYSVINMELSMGKDRKRERGADIGGG